jgi:DNA-binding CsgD family transcriptional regulator
METQERRRQPAPLGSEAHWRGRPQRGPDGLSATERRVLALLAEGYDCREIAQQLYYTHPAVSNCLSRLTDRLGLASTKQLLIYAGQVGLARVK